MERVSLSRRGERPRMNCLNKLLLSGHEVQSPTPGKQQTKELRGYRLSTPVNQMHKICDLTKRNCQTSLTYSEGESSVPIQLDG